jgi:phasin family protein
MTAKQTAAAKPAFDFDMFKSFGQFKAPGFDFEAMMATQRKNMEAATAANQRAFEGMNAMMSRQAEVVRESTESAMKVASNLAAVKPEERTAKQADFTKTAYEAFLANGREAYDMVAKTADEAMTLINGRVTATIEESQKAFAQK